VEGPEITHYWLKVKNPAYERKEPVEFRTTAKKFQELSFDVGRASLRERLYGGVLQCDAPEHAQPVLGEVAVGVLGDGAVGSGAIAQKDASDGQKVSPLAGIKGSTLGVPH
jgi:hypothetical protein